MHPPMDQQNIEKLKRWILRRDLGPPVSREKYSHGFVQGVWSSPRHRRAIVKPGWSAERGDGRVGGNLLGFSWDFKGLFLMVFIMELDFFGAISRDFRTLHLFYRDSRDLHAVILFGLIGFNGDWRDFCFCLTELFISKVVDLMGFFWWIVRISTTHMGHMGQIILLNTEWYSCNYAIYWHTEGYACNDAIYPWVPYQYQSNESFATSYQLQEKKQECSIVAPLANKRKWQNNVNNMRCISESQSHPTIAMCSKPRWLTIMWRWYYPIYWELLQYAWWEIQFKNNKLVWCWHNH